MNLALDVDQLRTFLAIADMGNFTKAADNVSKTQSAVSMQMKRLEEVLGKSLFTRDGRNSRLTIEGERLVDMARRMVALNDEVISSYRRPPLSGAIRFGTPDDYADLFLPELLARFARSHPMVTVDVECLSSSSLVERVRHGEMDLALVTSCGAAQADEILRKEKLLWVGSARHGIPSGATVPLATAQVGCAWRTASLSALEKAGRPYRVTMISPNRNAIDAAVLQGLAVAAMPEICVRPGMRILTEAEGFPSMGTIEIGLLRSPQKTSKAAEALSSYLRECFGDLGVAAGQIPASVRPQRGAAELEIV